MRDRTGQFSVRGRIGQHAFAFAAVYPNRKYVDRGYSFFELLTLCLWEGFCSNSQQIKLIINDCLHFLWNSALLCKFTFYISFSAVNYVLHITLSFELIPISAKR